MQDGLEAMAVEVGHEGGVVAGVVVVADAGRAQVDTAGGERGRVEAIDGFAARCRERDVEAAIGRLAVGAGVDDRERRLALESGGSIAHAAPAAGQRYVAERSQRSVVEGG